MIHVVMSFICVPQGILGSWLTWTVLCAIGHLVWSFEQVTLTWVTYINIHDFCVQSLSGPIAWLSGGYFGVLNILYEASVILCLCAVVFVLGFRR